MLSTRLWVGTILIGLTVGVLVLDQQLAPAYPFLFVLVLLLTLVGCHELLELLGTARRPSPWLCYTAVTALVAANWLPSVDPSLVPGGRSVMVLSLDLGPMVDRDRWVWIAGGFAAVVLAAFVVEMAIFHVPGESVGRISLTVWIAA